METPWALDHAIDIILDSWERWSGEAGQAAQQEQHQDAYTDTMREYLRATLKPLLDCR